jgi:GcrA cell cycle regulator
MPAPLNNTNATRAWDDERDNALRALLADKATFEQAAAELNAKFGTVYTRSAVGGRAMRLGVKASRTGMTERQRQHNRDLLQKGRETMRLKRAKAAAEPVVQPPPQFHRDNLAGLRCAEVEPMNIALVDLEPHHCRWPIGGWPDATPVRFCGQPRWEGSSYCGAHTVLARGDARGRSGSTPAQIAHMRSLMPTTHVLKENIWPGDDA